MGATKLFGDAHPAEAPARGAKQATIGLVLLALAACKSKKDEPAATPPPAPAPKRAAAIDAAPPEIDAAPAPAARGPVACPPDKDAVRAAAQKIFALKGEIGDAQCTALVVGGVGRWLIELGYDDPDSGEHFYAGLVDGSTGQATWNDSYESPEGVDLDKQEVADLDGNGDEELLTTQWGGSSGYATGKMIVRTVKDGKLVPLGELRLGYTSEGAVAIGNEKKLSRCDADVELIDGPTAAMPVKEIAIVGAKHVGKPPEDACPKLGRHVYALRDGALVEAE